MAQNAATASPVCRRKSLRCHGMGAGLPASASLHPETGMTRVGAALSPSSSTGKRSGAERDPRIHARESAAACRRCRTSACSAAWSATRAGGRAAPAWILGSPQFAFAPAPPVDDEGGEATLHLRGQQTRAPDAVALNVDRIAPSVPASRSFHSPFAFSFPPLIHAFSASLILGRSLSCGNACRDGGNAGRDRRIRRSGRRTVECRWVHPEFPTSPARWVPVLVAGAQVSGPWESRALYV